MFQFDASRNSIPRRVYTVRTMKSMLQISWFLFLALTVGVLACSAQLADKKALTLEVAKQLAAAAEKEAAHNKWTMVIAILDDGGNLLLLHRMDETQIGSIEVATAKARSAISFKRPTKVFEDAVAGGRNAILALPGAIPVEGGLPITVDGKIIGAIGASGGTSAQDGQAAKAGLDALPKILGK
jgi:glc operon protein GlcG